MARTQSLARRWVYRTFILLVAFLGSIYLSFYLSGRTFSFGALWQFTRHLAQSPNKPVLPETSAPDVAFETSENSTAQVPEVLGLPQPNLATSQSESHGFSCLDLSAGAVTRVPDTSVYRWVDDKGQVHFADGEPDSAMLAEVIGLGGERDQYFDLDILKLEGQLSVDVRNKIELRANKAYEILSGLVSELQRNKVALNIMLIEGRSAFEAYAADTGYLGAGNADGFYRMAKNQAVVLQNVNPERTLAISTHETVHVINAGLYGILPRWLNEGLSDYLEEMRVYGQAVEIPWQSKWSAQVSNFLTVGELIQATDQDWDGLNRDRLYVTSRTLVYFLMSSLGGKQWLSDYFTVKAGRVCDRINEEPFFNLHFGSVTMAQTEFQGWLQRGNPTSNHH